MSFACVLHFAMSSSAFHIMSSCALHLHTCSSLASEHFPRCPFCKPALLSPPVHRSCFLSCAGVKHSRNGPSLVKWPWYTTGRPPVKFCSIWRSFGTPTVNRVTAKSVCVLRQNPPSNSPKTPLSLRHALGRSITIAWAETAPRLDSPSSLYLYMCVSPEIFAQMNPSLPTPDAQGDDPGEFKEPATRTMGSPVAHEAAPDT